MKIYARQINPEYQESPLFMGDEFFPDNIAVCGNCDYRSHKPEQIEGYSVYCMGDTNEQIKQEIAADYTGATPGDVTLYAFDGYTKTPKYKQV